MTAVDVDDEVTAAGLVPYRLSICGLDELAGYAGAGVSHVVSILDPGWPDPAAFAAYPPHRRVVRRFHDVIAPRADAAAPAAADVDAILAWSAMLARERAAHVLVHCHAGVSRSTAAAVVLMACDQPGREAEAFDVVARIRPRSWPNSRMLALADARLGRGGALVEALRDHQRRVAAAHPDFAELLKGGERAHEVLGL